MKQFAWGAWLLCLLTTVLGVLVYEASVAGHVVARGLLADLASATAPCQPQDGSTTAKAGVYLLNTDKGI